MNDASKQKCLKICNCKGHPVALCGGVGWGRIVKIWQGSVLTGARRVTNAWLSAGTNRDREWGVRGINTGGYI